MTKSIDRRDFMKVVASGVISSSLTSNALFGATSLRSASLPSEVIRELLETAAKDEIGIQVLEDLSNLSAPFDENAVRYSESQDTYIGILLSHTSESSKRQGFDLALTFDVQRKVITHAQYIVGYSAHDRLDLLSTRFDARWPLYPEITNPRVLQGRPSKMIRPRGSDEWTFVRESEFIPLSKEQLTLVGWPPEDENTWHFGGAKSMTWLNDGESLIFLCREITEYKGSNPSTNRTVSLTYALINKGEELK